VFAVLAAAAGATAMRMIVVIGTRRLRPGRRNRAAGPPTSADSEQGRNTENGGGTSA
jgi:hypothetical protein